MDEKQKREIEGFCIELGLTDLMRFISTIEVSARADEQFQKAIGEYADGIPVTRLLVDKAVSTHSSELRKKIEGLTTVSMGGSTISELLTKKNKWINKEDVLALLQEVGQYD
jgi:hypothetical protein